LKGLVDLEPVDRLHLNSDFKADVHLKQSVKEEIDYKIVD